MKLLFSSVMALGMIGTAAMVADEQETRAGQATAAQELHETGLRFLIVKGAASCTIAKGAAITGTTSQLDVAAECADLYPALSNARYWRDGPHGTVAFAPAEGNAIIEFAEGDGVAYETFRRGSPLISLVAAD